MKLIKVELKRTLGSRSQQKIDVKFIPYFLHKNECRMLNSVLHFS